MSNLTKMKTRRQGNGTEVLVLINHPMETGYRVDKDTGRRVAAHYIETIRFELNGNLAAEANLGPGVSRNPLTGILLKSTRSGDRVSVSWADNRGGHGGATAMID